MLNFMYMVRNVICETFDNLVGRHQSNEERKALLVLFKIKRGVVKMLIHAPANYVGVYIQKGKKWECISYHDSCWRSDGVETFLFENRDDIYFDFLSRPTGFNILSRIVDGIYVV